VYGEQDQSAYNRYLESVCNHPLFLFDRQGDCLAAKLRPGNVHSAEGWKDVLLPDIDRQQVEELLTRLVGRPSHRPVVPHKGFLYRAARWSTAPRVVAKVEFHA
jgi:Transposase DDE domain group 1